MSVRVAAVSLVAGLLAVPGTSTGAEAAADVAVTCGGLRATVVGTDGDDRLRGTAGPDVIAGLGGDDVVRGLGGDDVLCGGAGSDTLLGGRGDDRLLGGSDRLAPAPFGSFVLIGDTLDGGDGDDLLDPGLDRRRSDDLGSVQHVSWATSISGVTIRILDDGGVRATGPGGTDRVRAHPDTAVTGSPHADRITGSSRDDSIDGGEGPDVIDGRDGDDELLPDGNAADGRRDDDRVRGGAGDDRIYPEAGRDLVHGGPGGDTIQSFGATVVAHGGPGRDDLMVDVTRRHGWTADGGPGDDLVSIDVPAALQTGLPLLSIDQSTGAAALGHDDGTVTRGTVAAAEVVTVYGTVRLDYVGFDGDESLSAQAGPTGDGSGRIHARMGAGDDVVRGSELADVVDGGPGRDRAFVRGGLDRCTRVEVRDSCELSP